MTTHHTPEQIQASFDAKTEKSPDPDGCWIWTAASGGSGTAYGIFRGDYAHRWSWSNYHKRKIPKDLCVLHSCDTPSCVNHRHLFLGTKKDNTRDMLDKRRNKGADSPKLSEQQVKEIYNLKGFKTQAQIAPEFGISPNMVGNIFNGKSWSHITGQKRVMAIYLEAKTVKLIYSLKGKETQAKIAKAFGVSRPLISMIHTGKCWANITGHKVIK